MVDCKYVMDTYKSVKISIATVMRNPEVKKVIPYHLQTKKNI